LPAVTVIVPAWNAEATIQPCLDSLLASDYPKERTEVIVVDNASTDRTSELLSHYRDRVLVLREEKRGPAAARNRGLQAASGTVVAFTDADCEVDPAWLRTLASSLRDPSVGIVGGRILSKRPCNRIELFGERIHDHGKAIQVSDPPYAITMNWVSRRSALQEAGGFDEEYLRCEDVDLTRRIMDAGLTLRYQHDAVVFHRNERTFAGLFREGFQHGFWAVRLFRGFPREYSPPKHPRIDWRGYRNILLNLMGTIWGPDRVASWCHVVFDSGKKLGRLMGSMRFGYVRL
jgi:cellulose synthase/poly-beta-1,6-N-acetylglucosamine synthase-like glycosyltransferase